LKAVLRATLLGTSAYDLKYDLKNFRKIAMLYAAVINAPNLFYFLKCYCLELIPVALRSKAQAFSRLVSGIAGSNPVEGMDICLLCLLYVV
jgi:hypothetical protein